MNVFHFSDESRGLSSEQLEIQRWNRTIKVYEKTRQRISWYRQRTQWIDLRIEAMNPVGDVNIDGKVEIADVTALIDFLLGSEVPYHAADVNGDGVVAINDVTALIDKLIAGS